ncbi:tRNA pseudouridine(13) synthase TruD [Arhodomonas sp. SL1]|uniref:tRNA pseudouridine(13) synthase TruD n=1 Tax=Arhodomonas sp. SL1 TaxID=3425691 RepID=UPI003F884911
MTAPPVDCLRPTPTLPAHGPPVGAAVLKERPEDFRVTEIPLVAPDGMGEHLLLEIRKRDLTTAEAGRRLARYLGCRVRDVSHAGLKDRRGVTRQWLSVHGPGLDVPPPGPVDDALEILQAARHRRKLRVGALAGNRFTIRLREVDAAVAAVDRRLAVLARRGVPNYFGAQRFGRQGDNLAEALAWQRGEGRPPPRQLQGLLLSAVRAEAFNRALRRRIELDCWDRAIDGDQMILDGRGSLFSASREPPEGLAHRLALQSIHPTGPLAGTGRPLVDGEAQRLEDVALAGMEELLALLERRRVRAARRALRLPVGAMGWWRPGPGELELGFTLSPGAYATTVLAECFEWRDPAV